MFKAVILAAGIGSRVGASDRGIPKCLLRVGNTPLLLRHIETLQLCGVGEIIVVAGHFAEQVVQAVPRVVRVVVNERYQTTNSLVSLLTAAPFLKGDGFLMQNADVMYSPGLIRRFLEHPAENACLVDADRPYSAAEYRIATEDGRISRYERGLSLQDSVGESAQLLKVGKADANAFLDRIEHIATTGGGGGFPLQAYPVLQAGRGLYPVYTARLPWWEVDTPSDLEQCETTHVVELQAVKPTARPAQTLTAGVVVNRATEYLRARKMPWRLELLLSVWRSCLAHPWRALKWLPQLWNQTLSRGGFELQVNGKKVLEDVQALAAAIGCAPMLTWGSLLGAVREGTFIRGDRDIDLAVLPDDAVHLASLRDALAARGYQIRIDTPQKLSMIAPHLPTLFVDIDVLDQDSAGWVIANRDSAEDRAFLYRFNHSVFSGPSRHVVFAGVPGVSVPPDPEGFLTAVYGTWQTPTEKVDYRYGPLNVEVQLLQSQ